MEHAEGVLHRAFGLVIGIVRRFLADYGPL